MENFGENALFAAWVVPLALAVLCLFYESPEDNSFRFYSMARRRYGWFCLFFAGAMLTTWIFGGWILKNGILFTWGLIVYYLAATIGSMLHFTLIDPSYLFSYKYKVRLANLSISVTLAILAACIGKGSVQTILTVVAQLIFIADCLTMLYRLYHLSNRSKRLIEENFTEDLDRFIMRNKTTGVLLLTVCLIENLMFFASYFVMAIEVIATMIVLVYGMHSFNMYGVFLYKLGADMKLFEEERLLEENKKHSIEEEPSACSTEENCAEDNTAYARLCTQIDKWLAEGGYRTQGITTMQLARIFGSNRRYITRYFHDEKQCTFRECINHLRIDEGKTLLSDTDLTIDAVAERLGFSRSHFATTFKALEGVSPAEWRERNRATS